LRTWKQSPGRHKLYKGVGGVTAAICTRPRRLVAESPPPLPVPAGPTWSRLPSTRSNLLAASTTCPAAKATCLATCSTSRNRLLRGGGRGPRVAGQLQVGLVEQVARQVALAADRQAFRGGLPMKLSRACGYALAALVHLARQQPEGHLTSRAIAES